MTITVHTKPGCMPCKLTKDWLNRHHIDHLTVDVTASPAALEHVVSLGYQQMPVVTVTAPDGTITDHWSGLRPDMLNTLLEAPEAVA